MQDIAVGDYSTEDVLRSLRGQIGHREWRFRYELLNSSNEKIRDLGNMFAGSVKQDFRAEVKRTATFSVRDDSSINYLSQRIRPYAGVRMPDGGWAEWSLGVFLLTSPKRSIDVGGVVVRDVEAYDQTQVLIDDTVPARYYVGANVLFTDAIREVLSKTMGLSSFFVADSNTTTASALEWEPGTSRYQIIADLIGAINYKSIWFDGNGVARVEPYESLATAAPEFVYETDDVSMVLADAEVDTDYYKLPNRWVLIVSNPDQPSLRAEVRNDNPYSPSSIVNRGRIITKVVTDVSAPNAAVLQSIAERMRDEDGHYFETLNFKTGIMPFHESGDVFDFAYYGFSVAGRFLELGWEFELTQGSEMTHSAQRTISVLTGFGVGPFGLMPFGG